MRSAARLMRGGGPLCAAVRRQTGVRDSGRSKKIECDLTHDRTTFFPSSSRFLTTLWQDDYYYYYDYYDYYHWCSAADASWPL